MFLLNSQQITEEKDNEGGSLKIGSFNEVRLHHTFYYIALGRDIERQGKTSEWCAEKLGNDVPLRIDPGECVRVCSLESFTLKARVMGILGSTSTLAQKGVALLHGSFIDPLYPPPEGGRQVLTAPLRMALVNHGRFAVDLQWGEEVIAKVSFFDTTDTYPVSLEKPWLKQD